MPSSVPAREDVRSPLLTENSRRSGEVWEDATAIARQSDKEGESKSSWYLFLLTLSIGGLQIVWSVELSNGSPYLLSLGMSKSLLAFVWIAGPLTGTLVQPYVGIRSDNCRVPWGKRKPFMIGGGIATVISLMALAWVREMVGGVLGIFGAGAQSQGVKVTTIVVATLFMFCLDFAINTVQAAIRAFIVDKAPAHQQESANAWASRLTAIGNILEGPPRSKNPGVICFFKQVFASIKRLPPQIRKVCEVQLCAWVGWFPFLFYSTTYIGQLYVNPIFDQHPDLPEDAISAIWEEATRVGTFALLAYAVTSFVASMVLPLLVVPTYRPALAQDSDTDTTSSDRPYLSRHPSTSTLSFTASAGAAIETSHEAVQPSEKYNVLSKLQIPGLTLRRLWFLSHVLFSLCMFSTFLIYSPQAGTVVIAIVGISWALTLWAPFAFISAEVAKSDAENRERRHQLRQGIPDLSHGHPGSECDENGSSEEKVDQAGVILGIHNVAISFPQIASTLISSAIFKALQKPRGEPWDDSVGWVLRFGGCAALGAAYITTRLGEGAGGKTSGENGDMA
ncbi:alpha-glucoside transporter [Coccidioides immitis RMSCC 3703]|uniref:Alpha-glucoside transporter n=1 Tax=Coccidioides immitis RMSCC 3703 TaxID=454286 RepID=A0A0J8QUR9_COCIT|nr:alpha-glucoside transporter [Coccidioides immitis RMSCC 3703]